MATQIKTTQIKNFNEDIQDMLSSFLVQWSNITLTYNDVANTLTIASTGWGGGWSLTVYEMNRQTMFLPS